MKANKLAPVALVATVLLLGGCAGSADPAAPGSAGGNDSEYFLDPATEGISDEAAARITELYQAAQDAGEDELSIISGLAEDMEGTWEAFEETFPEISVTSASLIGAPLITQLQSEVQSGNHVTDVLHNPNGQQYVDFAQEYEVVGLTVPDGLDDSADQLVDPEHRYTSPFIGFFGYGVFLPRADDLHPAEWSDLTEPEYEGLVVMGDPNLPGPSQDAPIYLSQNGAFTDEDIQGLADNVIVKGTYGDAVAALMQGQAAFMFAAPASALISAQDAGAPVEFRLMEKDNYVVTHKQLLLEGAPHPNVGKLYLEWLNTFTAQEAIADAGLAPLNVDAADPEAPWTDWEAANLEGIVPWTEIDEIRQKYIDDFPTIFASS
ncbi:MAG: extracellular solute-binding protein [Microbacterium sp.]